jgi:hypothetical protein
MSRQKISLNNLSGPDSRDLSVRYPADMIRVSAWYCQNLSEVPACCLGIDRGRLCAFYLPVLPLYGFTKFYTNPFLLIYLLLNFKLPVLILIGCLEQKNQNPCSHITPFSNVRVPANILTTIIRNFGGNVFFYSGSVHSGIQPLPLKIF